MSPVSPPRQTLAGRLLGKYVRCVLSRPGQDRMHRRAAKCDACDAPGVVAPKEPILPRPGDEAEAALYIALGNAAFIDIHSTSDVPLDAELRRVSWLRQYPWGAYLSPPRRFSSDAGFPNARLLVEVDGGAHAAGKAKLRADTHRRGLAAAAGWRVLALTPDQVHSGEAVALVRAALHRGASVEPVAAGEACNG